MQALEIDPAATGARDRRRMLGALVALAAISGDATRTDLRAGSAR